MGGYTERPKIIVNDDNLIDSLIQWEGFLPRPTDIGDGKITLGSGLTDPKWVKLYKQRGNVWSKEDNRMAVAEEVAKRRDWAQKNVPNWELMHPESQKALLSYKYNYDFNHVNSPKLFKALEDKNWEEVARQMDATSKDPKFKKGLEDRRRKEQNWHRKGVRLQQEELQNAQRTEAIPNRSFGEGIREFLMSPFKREPKSGSWAEGGKLLTGRSGMANVFELGGNQKAWREKHKSRWYNFLKRKGLSNADANRLSGFFTVQDGLESAGGTSAAAREKNNYGGMQRGGKNVSYDSINDYMEDKWRMMNNRFKHALRAKSIDEFATTLGNPDLAGKNYLYYVTDKVKYDPQSSAWRNAQTQHMHNYINGMRTWAGMSPVKFNNGLTGEERRNEIYGKYGNYEQTPVFMPRNPEAFFAPLSTYARPMEMKEPEQPLVDMAVLQASAERKAQREQRQRGLELLMGLMGGNGNGLGSLLGLIGKQ